VIVIPPTGGLPTRGRQAFGRPPAKGLRPLRGHKDSPSHPRNLRFATTSGTDKTPQTEHGPTHYPDEPFWLIRVSLSKHGHRWARSWPKNSPTRLLAPLPGARRRFVAPPRRRARHFKRRVGLVGVQHGDDFFDCIQLHHYGFFPTVQGLRGRTVRPQFACRTRTVRVQIACVFAQGKKVCLTVRLLPVPSLDEAYSQYLFLLAGRAEVQRNGRGSTGGVCKCFHVLGFLVKDVYAAR